MSATLHRHPRFAELRGEFRDHPEWFTPWTGTLFRFHTVDFPTAKDVLSGGGARINDEKIEDPLMVVSAETFASSAEIKISSGKKKHGIVELVKA
jgi:hypothetical protein